MAPGHLDKDASSQDARVAVVGAGSAAVAGTPRSGRLQRRVGMALPAIAALAP
jgi:hypothetical protein